MTNPIKKISQLSLVSCLVLFTQLAVADDIDFARSIDLMDSTLSLDLQPAVSSTAVINQAGNQNISANLQAGMENQAYISQLGNDNLVMAVQSGDSNFINIMQLGDNNTADVYQFGSYNTANIEQYGNQNFSLEQYSDHATVTITQF